MMSRLVWARVLKGQQGDEGTQPSVAPRVGAFIERRSLHTVFVTTKSHPVWVRLLKGNFAKHRIPLCSRASCRCVY